MRIVVNSLFHIWVDGVGLSQQSKKCRPLLRSRRYTNSSVVGNKCSRMMILSFPNTSFRSRHNARDDEAYYVQVCTPKRTPHSLLNRRKKALYITGPIKFFKDCSLEVRPPDRKLLLYPYFLLSGCSFFHRSCSDHLEPVSRDAHTASLNSLSDCSVSDCF